MLKRYFIVQTKKWLLLIVSAVCLNNLLQASELGSNEFAQFLTDSGEQKAPVIILLKPNKATKAKVKKASSEGEWLNLSDYIDAVQRELAADMGWINFNDIVKYKYVPAMAKSIDAESFAKLQKSKLVEAIYPDRFNPLNLTHSSKALGLAQVKHARDAGSGTSVVVIDSGIEAQHPFLQGKVIAGACFSRNGSCSGGQRELFGIDSGLPCSGAQDCMHGTHVAGIVAGSNAQMQGVAPAANILSVNVASRVGDKIGMADSDIVQALEWALAQSSQYNIAAVNMSLGGGLFDSTCDDSSFKYWIDLLLENQIVTVISSGNEGKTGQVGSPGCVSSAVTVGSLQPDNEISKFSNSYAALDIVAPGGQIVSSVLNGRYAASSGTSMAAPQVAGAIALLRGKYPNASARQIIQALKQGPEFRDPRNGITTPRLYLPAAQAWLAKHAKQTSAVKKRMAKPNCESKRVDGILIEQSNSGCQIEKGQSGKNSDEIDW